MSEATAVTAIEDVAGRPEEDCGPLRLTDAGLAAILEQFQASPLLSSGKVNIIALDAIAERLGSRWRVRQDLVHEHAQNVLRSRLGASSFVQRISATEYIVAQPDVSRLAGQALCLNGLREILQHFLGEAPVGDLRVHEVTRITATGVFGQRLAVGDIDAAVAEPPKVVSAPAGPADEAAGDKPAERAPAVGDAEQSRWPSMDRWTPFVSSIGRRIGVSASLEPVMLLRNSNRIGYRVTRRVLELPAHTPLSVRDFEALSPADTEKIDLATIARGIDRARVADGEEKPPSLILPVSYTTVRSGRCRSALLALLQHAHEAVSHGLIVEITGIDGAPAAALPEVISVLRPVCRHVIGRLSDGLDQDARLLRGAGLDGLSVRCPPTAGDASFIGWTKGLVAAATRIAKTLFVYQVASIRHARLAASLGVTHATLAPQRLKVHRIDDELPAGVFRSVRSESE